MPIFAIVTDKATKVLGNFNSREDVLKLTIFKGETGLRLQKYIREMPVPTTAPKKPKVERSSNRWAVITENARVVYLCGQYTRSKVEYIFRVECNVWHTAKFVVLPKYAYHETDGREYNSNTANIK
jgi:hypothetical protein